MKDNSLTDLVLNTISFVAQQTEAPIPERIRVIEFLLERYGNE